MDSKLYDVMILGAGPAGLAAGLYAGRAKLSVLIIEKGIDGGQIALTHGIENYPGQANVEGMSGPDLIAPLTEQCRKFGCERVSDTIHACELEGPVKKLIGSRGEYRGKTVILCTGAMTRSIGCKNEAQFVGRGISYCAVCDANFFEGLEIFVVGGNNLACEEALYLANYGRSVTVLHKGAALAVSPELKKQIEENPKLRVLCDTQVEEVGGQMLLEEITVRNLKTGETSVFKADPADGVFGLFGFTGKKTTAMFDGLLDMENGYIKTNERMETNIPGVYAAGDVRVTPLRQVVTACADGAIAAMQCGKYIQSMK
jgi:thioredoxin reductase (NADPH)